MRLFHEVELAKQSREARLGAQRVEHRILPSQASNCELASYAFSK
jgi:hypothetical protein